MKVLPSKLNLKLSINENFVTLHINDNYNLKYINTDKSDNDVLQDLIECKAFSTTLLYLNEYYNLDLSNKNYLVNESNIQDFYEDCEELLNMNTTIVEEVGIPLTDINGYKIFEGNGYILRGNSDKKIKESFEIDLFPEIKKKVEQLIKDKTNKYDIYDFIEEQNRAYSIDKDEAMELKALVDSSYDKGINEVDGTQCNDIAPKVDQNLGTISSNPKKKYYDVLLSDINENDFNFINHGFLKNNNGQYQRGNYIIIKEGEKYLAINKNNIK